MRSSIIRAAFRNVVAVVRACVVVAGANAVELLTRYLPGVTEQCTGNSRPSHWLDHHDLECTPRSMFQMLFGRGISMQMIPVSAKSGYLKRT